MQRRRFQTRRRAPGNDPVQCTREGADSSPLRCCNWPNAVWRYEDVMSAKWAILVFNWCSIDKYHSAPSISTRGPVILACLWLDNRSDGGEQQCTRAKFLMVFYYQSDSNWKSFAYYFWLCGFSFLRLLPSRPVHASFSPAQQHLYWSHTL